jgi:hypothetical protein
MEFIEFYFLRDTYHYARSILRKKINIIVRKSLGLEINRNTRRVKVTLILKTKDQLKINNLKEIVQIHMHGIRMGNKMIGMGNQMIGSL